MYEELSALANACWRLGRVNPHKTKPATVFKPWPHAAAAKPSQCITRGPGPIICERRSGRGIR